jgi:hypothetical protein
VDKRKDVAMLSWKPVLWGLLVIPMGCLFYAAEPSEKQERPTPVKINAKDLCDGKYVIIGLLGKPYGEISIIRGVWSGVIENTLEGYRTFQITHIDGKPIDSEHPMIISESFVERLGKDKETSPKQGETYEGRVYEGGGYRYGRPAEALRILKEPVTDFPMDYKFESFLFFLD